MLPFVILIYMNLLRQKSRIRTLTSASGRFSSRATVLKTAVIEMEVASGSKLPESTGEKK